MNSSETRAAITLATVYVLRMLGLFMVIPVLAVAAIEFPDYSPFLVGIAIGGYGLTQALLQIPMGVLSDKWGRKPVIYLGLSFFIIGSLVAANADSMLVLTVGRILQGAGAIAGAVMALASDVTRESQRAKVMAIIGVSIGFSFYIALLLGPIIANTFGIQGIFWITAVLTICCIPLIHVGVKSPDKLVPSGDTLPKVEQLSALFKDPTLCRLNLSVLVVHLLITCFFVQVPSLLIMAELDLGDHWKVYTPILFISVVLLVLLMQVGKRLPISVSFVVSLALMASAFGIFLIPNLSWSLICVAGILFFAGFNYMEAHMPAMVSSVAPAGSKGSAMGIYASHQFFGAFLGGMLSGALLQWLGPTQAMLACIVVILFCVVIVWGLHNPNAHAAKSKGRVKRVSIQRADDAQLSDADSRHARQALEKLADVLDVTFSQADNTFYLKVQGKEFDLALARQIVDDKK